MPKKRSLLAPVFGWIFVSIVCWIVNFLLLHSNPNLNEYWAWMPTAGVFTWPLMQFVIDSFMRRLGKNRRDFIES